MVTALQYSTSVGDHMLLLSTAGTALRITRGALTSGCTSPNRCLYASTGVLGRWRYSSTLSRADLERLSPSIDDLGLEAGDHGELDYVGEMGL